ncbi:hypothetical protein HYQ46_007489 [Verticillium longisporum]|nr:hypothetical protein HYQ46_007489 [Verticillium longisporum]
MKVSAILAASVASLAIAAPLTEGNLGLENASIDNAKLSDLQAELFTCISNPACMKKLQQGALASPAAPLGNTKRQEVTDFQKFQDKLLTCSNNRACAKKLDKLKIPGQVLEPENTKEILENIGNVQTCLDTAKCRKDLFDQIDKLIDDTKKSKRQVGGPRPGGILDGLKACLRKPECRERMLKQAKDAQVAGAAGKVTKRQRVPVALVGALSGLASCLADPACAKQLIGRRDAQAAAAAGETTKRQTDPFPLDGVMACLEDLECAAELMANLDGPN